MAFAIPLAATALGASAGTAATLGTIATVASTAFSVLGAIKSSQAARAEGDANAASARYNAAVAANNKKLAEQNAGWSREQGNQLVEQQQKKTRAEVASLSANQAASGVNLNSGSFTDVRSSAKETGQLSAIDIRTKAARQAYGYDTESAGYEGQKNLYNSEAVSDSQAGKTAGDTALFTGLSSAADSFGSYLDKKSLSTPETWANGDPFR